MSPNMSPEGGHRQQESNQRAAEPRRHEQNHQDDWHGYDDGLVHSHGWAMTSPER